VIGRKSATLDQFRTNSTAKIPGTPMPVTVPKADKRAIFSAASKAAEAVTFLGNHLAHFQAIERSNPIEP
jgi:hypothetical protein